MTNELSLKQALGDLKKNYVKEDIVGLRELSNNAIERAAMTENKALVSVSLIAYALSKLLTKPHVLSDPSYQAFKNKILKGLETPLEALLGEIIREISAFDAGLGNYVVDVVEKARLKQASRIYSLGISLKKAASLTGADASELFSYVGTTKTHEQTGRGVSIRRRYEKFKRVLEG